MVNPSAPTGAIRVARAARPVGTPVEQAARPRQDPESVGKAALGQRGPEGRLPHLLHPPTPPSCWGSRDRLPTAAWAALAAAATG